MMKLTATFALIVLLNPLATNADELDQILQQCGAQHGESISNTMNVFDPNFQTTDENLKCVVLCIGQDLQIMTANGQLIQNMVLQDAKGLFDSTRVAASLQQCMQTAIGGPSACDMAFSQWQCLTRAAASSRLASYGQQTNNFGPPVMQSSPGGSLQVGTGMPPSNPGFQNQPPNGGNFQNYPQLAGANPGMPPVPNNQQQNFGRK